MPQPYERMDPIVDTPNRRKQDGGRIIAQSYDSAEDSGDEIFDDEVHITQPTLPIARPCLPYNDFKAQVSSPTQFVTQPTQILTPKAQRTDASIVQVAASSPASQRLQPSPSPAPPRSLGNIMAPPGTTFRRPVPVPAPAPAGVDLSSDPPLDLGSSDDEDTMARSNIKPSAFSTGGIAQTYVEETPKKNSFGMNLASQFGYKPSAVPRKRHIDDMASAYANSSRKRPQVARQMGPSRAIPVEEDIGLEDIPDVEVRRKVNQIKLVFPKATNLQCQNALARCKGNFDDAMSFLVQTLSQDEAIVISDDELARSPAARPSKPAAKRQVQGPQKSIQEKWSSTQAGKLNAHRQVQAPPRTIQEKWSSTQAIKAKSPVRSTVDNSPPAKPRRRLIQGRKDASSPPGPPSPQVLPSRSRPIVIDSDNESDSAVGMADEGEDGDLELEERLLKFFNASSANDLADLSNEKLEVAERIISKRPFKSLDQIRKVDKADTAKAPAKKRGGNSRRTLGDKIVDICWEMFTGYEAVDELVSHCEALGKPLQEEMKRWGINIHGATKDGELAMTSFSESGSNHDSGIGSQSPADEDSQGESVGKGAGRPKASLLGKPKIMAEDLELKDYQLVGLNWMNLLWTKGLSCILADDMGLGKTCQVITFLSHLYETGDTGPHLIIVPGSTLENWLREFQKFSPSLVVQPYYGLQREREEQRANIEDNLGSINVVITTYDIAWKNEDNRFLRKDINPVVCIYDEGHLLKNSETKRYQMLMKIPAKFRLLLSGTPLQNNLQELASLLAFIMPDIFQDRHEDLQYIFKHKVKTTDADHAALLSAQRIARARSMMTPFILRRKKHQVLKHLPNKISRVEYCELSPPQKAIYDEQLEKQRKVLEDRAAGRINKEHANVMMRLRQAALHHLLFRKIYDDSKIRKMARAAVKDPDLPGRNEDLVYEDMSCHTDYQCHQLCERYTTLRKWALHTEWMNSGKVQKLCELLKRFKKNGDRTLIFSQFTTVMDILESVLETLDMQFFRLDGSTPIPRRQDMLDEFYNDTSIPVFMLSTKSGGAGINLACANKVIIFDSSFNPQDDIQAENRAHRVGQTREVEVIRLVTRGTIEEQIHALGNSKLALDERVAGEGAADDKVSKAEEMGINLVEDMLMKQMKGDVAGGVLEARLEQANLLKKVVDAIKDLVQDCNFDCNDSGIALQAMDNSHVALVSMMLKSESFSPFRCDRNIALGINLTSLTKVLRCAQNEDILTLKAEDAPDVVNLVFESPETDRLSEYDIKLMDIDQEHLGIPETDYAATITMPSAEFQRICRDLMALSESVAIECTKEGVKFACSGDIGSGSVTLRSHQNLDKPDQNVEIDLTEPVSLTFSLKYLVNFCKASGLSGQVKLCLSNEVPLLVEYALANNSYLRFYLAPKIGDEE